MLPAKASTVVVLLTTTTWPLKVLLIKRSEKLAFLPGAHVFPGGKMENIDIDNGRKLCQEVDLTSATQFKGLSPIETSEFVACAMRETEEETGIDLWHKTQNGRLESFWPISWWITPPGETRRFNTCFFLTTVGEETLGGNQENDDHRWLSPHHALAAHESRKIFLAPPTRAILERLALCGSLAETLSHLDAPIEPIRPQFVTHPAGKLLVLPGDPLHPVAEPSRFIPQTRYFFDF
jgi:8-oxo-dGTP pyrophosphatase MutT (NUDIX family)